MGGGLGGSTYGLSLSACGKKPDALVGRLGKGSLLTMLQKRSSGWDVGERGAGGTPREGSLCRN